MIPFLVLLALLVAALAAHLRSGADYDDRDRRSWWPGAR